MKPSDLGLKHDTWRPHQEETTAWALEQHGHTFLEAPTGSGKTAIAAALASKGSVMALAQTKMLQKENYGTQYGFDILFGRGNYPCALLNGKVSGSECGYAQNMHACPKAHECEYLIEKSLCQGSSLVSLNYAYYLSARWPRQRGASYLVMDECDELPEIVLERAGITVTDEQRHRYKLPNFQPINSKATVIFEADPVEASIHWLKRCIAAVSEQIGALKDPVPGSKASQQLINLSTFRNKIVATREAMEASPEDWYIRSGDTARSFRGNKQPGFIARPLTARHHASLWFAEADSANLMMSATIGSPETLAAELGIAEFSTRSVPSVWPVESRYIWAPKDGPAIGQKSTESAYVKQAEMMADAIHGCPPEWSGVALMTRKSEAPLVAQRLARYNGLGDRVWVPPQVSTDEQSRLWEERKRKVPGSIMLSWAHWR